jgi:hypothetical protein
MAFDPNWPPTNAELLSADFRNQFQGLKALIDALQAQVNALPAGGAEFPVGSIVGWNKSFPNTPPLPGVWVECNGQTINDPGSPYNGLNVQDLNGAQGGVPVFLRGANASGGTGGAESHSHGLPLNISGGNAQSGADVQVFPPGNYTSDPASSLPPYYEVVWVMRVR